MARVNQKAVKEKLNEWAELSGEIDTLEAQRFEATRPIREKLEAKIAKAEAEFVLPVADARKKLAALEDEIKAELQKGFDAAANDYSAKKIETDDALVEINTSEQREISAADWLKEVPTSQRDSKFFGTLKVMIGKANDFRSDLVAKLATGKRTHSISFRVK